MNTDQRRLLISKIPEILQLMEACEIIKLEDALLLSLEELTILICSTGNAIRILGESKK